MTPAEVHRLRAEIGSDRAAFEARVDELSTIDPSAGAAAVLAQAAIALHHAYGAIEAALARVARLLEGSLPQGADWHHQLLRTMALEIPSVRPRVLSEASAAGLQKLLAFRHFFRHAYAVAWDPAQLVSLTQVARDLREPLRKDIGALDDFLAKLATAIAP